MIDSTDSSNLNCARAYDEIISAGTLDSNGLDHSLPSQIEGLEERKNELNLGSEAVKEQRVKERYK